MPPTKDPNSLAASLDRKTLDAETKKALASRLRFYREMGIYDFYQREVPAEVLEALATRSPKSAAPEALKAAKKQLPELPVLKPVNLPEANVQDRAEALRLIAKDVTPTCILCKLGTLGRKQTVFGEGDPHSELMFVGEGPGADEDEQGRPFVGRAGQLLTNMINAMGLQREQVYIANVVKCRPPGNRTPEPDEIETCSPFLLRQIDVVRPKVIVALGATAAKTLLGVNEAMIRLRGSWYDFRGIRLAVTYHPAYLLRDPNQKKEAWKDLQMVMKELGLKSPAKA